VCARAPDASRTAPADDVGRPGIWERVASAQAAWHADSSAATSSPGTTDYAELVKQTGIEVVDSGPLQAVATLTDTTGAAVLVARYVQAALRNLTDRLAAADIDALRTLGTERPALRSQIEVDQSRVLVIGRAPEGQLCTTWHARSTIASCSRCAASS
jgi:hypothetical protein